MNMASKIQNKCDEIWEENWYEDSKLKKLKAVDAAILSGAIDGAVIAYPIMVGISLYTIYKCNKIRKMK